MGPTAEQDRQSTEIISRLHLIRADLDELYEHYNFRHCIHPDPLEFLYEWDDPLEREIVGLISSSLAYGRVAQILQSVRRALEPMRPSPLVFIRESSMEAVRTAFSRFRHRFSTGEELACLLGGIKRVCERFGSLQSCFASHITSSESTVIPALTAFVRELSEDSPPGKNSLLSLPSGGSACKRLNLFLRWMIRSDAVDPGCWKGISPSKLIVPLDTHMLRIGNALKMSSRACGDLRTALQITGALRNISPEDPLRYDFCLTRLGISGSRDAFIRKLSGKLGM